MLQFVRGQIRKKRRIDVVRIGKKQPQPLLQQLNLIGIKAEIFFKTNMQTIHPCLTTIKHRIETQIVTAAGTDVKMQSLCQDGKEQKHLKSLHFHMQQFGEPEKKSQKVKKPTIANLGWMVLIATAR